MFDSKQKLFQEFISTMTKVRRIMDQMSNVSLEDRVATMLQMQALTYLKEHSQLTVGELAAKLHMSSSAIAQLSERLVLANFVSRGTDENDRRIVLLKLTGEGRKELERMHQKMIEKMGGFLEYISEDDLKAMIRIHKKVLDKLEKK